MTNSITFRGSELASFVRSINDTGEKYEIHLPNDTYRWSRELRFTGGGGEYSEPLPDYIGLLGEGDTRIEVDMRPNCTQKPSVFFFGTRRDPLPRVELRNLHFDIGDADPMRDAGLMRAYIGDRMETSNISLTRRCRLNADGSRNGDRHTFLTCCVDRDATAIHENVDLTAGDTHRPKQSGVGHAIGFAAEPPHVGTAYYRDCKIAGYTDNGFYVRDGYGKSVLEGCTARNCGGGHIRLGYHDVARDCKVVVDGTDEPANGCAVWLQDTQGTVAERIRVIAPAMENDVFRTSGVQNGGAIRDCYVELGETGEYVWKARGDGGATFRFDGNVVEDECTGQVREASYSLAQAGVRIRDLTHRGEGGRIPFAFRAESVVEGSRVTVDGMLVGRLGSLVERGATVHVRIRDCRFVDESGYDDAFKAYRSPDLRWFVLTDNDFSETGYRRAIANRSLSDFDVASIERCEGIRNP